MQRLKNFNKVYALQLATIFLGFIIFGISENIKGPAIPRIQFDFNLNEQQLGTLLYFKCLRLSNCLFVYYCSSEKMGDQGCKYFILCLHAGFG